MTGSTVIIPQYVQAVEEFSAVKLARYAQLVGYDENPFWGINYQVGDHSCRHIWTLSERKFVAKYLSEAQIEIEDALGYKIGAQWTVETKRRLTCPVQTQWGWLIAFGVEAWSAISLGAAVNHAADPCVIGPIVSSVTDASEIVICHPGTRHEIAPSKITIAAGQITIEIPKCRLVAEAYADNPESGYEYSDYAALWGELTVDVWRRYNDPSVNAVLSTNHNCSSTCSSAGCVGFSHEACAYIQNYKLGIVETFPAEYISGSWVRESCLCRGYDEVQLNYLSGVDLNYQTEDMIVRLAHSKMPYEPCGCAPLQKLWERDHSDPEFLTTQQSLGPFGHNNGAWTVWKWAKALRLMRGGIVG